MRHRSPHFLHVFSGGGYASGYYSYMWSEVLDADAFEAFKDTGDVFDPATASRLRDDILAAGGSRDPGDAYKAFRGPAADPGRAAAQARLRRSRGGLTLGQAGISPAAFQGQGGPITLRSRSRQLRASIPP